MPVRDSDTITIGLFDSGVGGLSVLRQLEKLPPTADGRQYRFVYVGDTARCPYGNRDAREVDQFVEEIIGWLLMHQADHIVMACNTSAALSLDHAKRVSPVPVHNLIFPTARYLANRYKKVGVLATYSTIKSRAFSRAVRALNPSVEVIEIACPDLVPLVESGFIEGEQTAHVLSKYANQLRKDSVEAVVLGCTHFPFLQNALSDLLPASIELVDPARMLLAELDSRLHVDAGYDNFTPAPAQHKKLFVTGDTHSFTEAAATCLGIGTQRLLAGSTVSGVSLDDLSVAYDCAMVARNAASEPAVTNVVVLPSVQLGETAERRSSITG